MESNLHQSKIIDFERKIQVLNVERNELKYLPPQREVYQRQGNLLFLVPKRDELIQQKEADYQKLIDNHAKYIAQIKK